MRRVFGEQGTGTSWIVDESGGEKEKEKRIFKHLQYVTKHAVVYDATTLNPFVQFLIWQAGITRQNAKQTVDIENMRRDVVQSKETEKYMKKVT